MNKMVKTISAVAIASAFMLSCSDEGGSGDSSGSETFTEVFAIKEITDDSFTYVSYEDYYCKSDGTLEKEEGTSEENYSINGNILTIKWSEDIEFNFNGTSSGLIGTWTRNKNKNAHCNYRPYGGDIDDEHFWCHGDYDIIKAVFTQNSVSYTHDVCWNDRVEDGSVNKGWATKVIDCNNTEFKKGNEVVKHNIKYSNNYNSRKDTYAYNGKSCELSISRPSVSQQEKACKDAVEKAAKEGGDYDEYYWDILEGGEYEKFEKCLGDNNFPEDLDFFGGSSGGGGNDTLAKQGKLSSLFSSLRKKRQ